MYMDGQPPFPPPPFAGLSENAASEFSSAHLKLRERLQKTLYYGNDVNPRMEGLSGPVADIAVELFQNAAPNPMRKLQRKYASHVAREACVSPCAMMLAVVYIERLKRRNPEYLQNISSSDLFLISMMVASKYLYDEGEEEEVFNDEWGTAGKLDTDTVNALEMAFLQAIDWDLFVRPHDFFGLLSRLEGSVAWQQGTWRGWFSYMDLCVLLDQTSLRRALTQLYLQFAKVACLCGVVYLAGLLGVLGSTAALHRALSARQQQQQQQQQQQHGSSGLPAATVPTLHLAVPAPPGVTEGEATGMASPAVLSERHGAALGYRGPTVLLAGQSRLPRLSPTLRDHHPGTAAGGAGGEGIVTLRRMTNAPPPGASPVVAAVVSSDTPGNASAGGWLELVMAGAALLWRRLSVVPADLALPQGDTAATFAPSAIMCRPRNSSVGLWAVASNGAMSGLVPGHSEAGSEATLLGRARPDSLSVRVDKTEVVMLPAGCFMAAIHRPNPPHLLKVF
ncbi:protein CNPPD1 isoform X1 [Petromyzon marinus]|uniref:protein CNPPD1 isoform X1 n=2 Tax=Petromyzon marinus TaxID=7757 RepID=UPI003F701EA1